MLLVPQLLCWLGLMALVHASPPGYVQLERGNCPQFWWSFGHRCYRFMPARVTWHEAEKTCLSHGAYLASIHSEEEDKFILDLIRSMDQSPGMTWIGLNDLYVEGRFLWSDGTKVGYNGWHSSQPDEGTNGNCVVTNWYPQWCDHACSSGFPSVCVRT